MTIRPVVLAVDDDPRLLDVYQAILETRYEVLTAPDGRAALDILGQRTVDVVLLDMLMPGLSGLGVLEALNRLGIETNVVMVSGMNDPASALEALRLGAADYLSKPFAVAHLHQVIRRLTAHAGAAVAPSAGRGALPHALIVSVDVGLRVSLAVALRTRGRVDAVTETGAALAVLARTRPDVVAVSDEAVAVAIRAAAPEVPIVATDARRPDFDALLRAIIDAFAVRHTDVRHFVDPMPRVLAHVAAHYRRATVESIAAAIAMSPGRLARVFAEAMEMTVTEYVTHVALEAARPELAKVFRHHARNTAMSFRAR
jgi:CheY-like chemotaxis protein/AraC-like DNA-binding protein